MALCVQQARGHAAVFFAAAPQRESPTSNAAAARLATSPAPYWPRCGLDTCYIYSYNLHMQYPQAFKLVQASALFRDLQPQETAAIIDRLRPVRFASGARIMQQGVWHGCLYIIAAGQVSVFLQAEAAHPHGASAPDESSALVLARLGPGECFGEMSLISGDRNRPPL